MVLNEPVERGIRQPQRVETRSLRLRGRSSQRQKVAAVADEVGLAPAHRTGLRSRSSTNSIFAVRQGPFAANDHLSTYLQAIFAFIGITDVEIIRAEGIAYGPDQDAAAMADAKDLIEAIAAAA